MERPRAANRRGLHQTDQILVGRNVVGVHPAAARDLHPFALRTDGGEGLTSRQSAGGAVVGAGSYIGCNQQRARAASVSNGTQYRASSNLRIRSGPGANYRQAGSLSAGQPFTAIGSQGEWVQIAGGGWVNAHYVTAY